MECQQREGLCRIGTLNDFRSESGVWAQNRFKPIARQDTAACWTEKEQRSLTLWPEAKANRRAVLIDSHLMEAASRGSKGAPHNASKTRGKSHGGSQRLSYGTEALHALDKVYHERV